ncbi:C6 finger domain protein, putative [Talaromyces stipitatus ATCC 10500]|uniref:C6 finger domain protein, putative n=1 Tax=Talaromyces stipitatus (strain ATCC 10500 / CBS 375.48 / QM 6759 / NRRL 1006) TaxID=441959 RepID=B8M955_TALSN|nr:C6 finger domain protein, putative [Talaromyces stipitatus ATCC 10500]EED17350.1 C6 finger domain protein, putative [Talaromyces stipitatus ATCC 10500]
MVAKLRTLTGCLQCRRRRKKCDETKPACAGCRRNGLYCQWPGPDSVDKRCRRYRRAATPKSQSPPELTAHDNRQIRIPKSIKHFHHSFDQKGSMLVEYCLFSFLPSQYHQAADGKPTVDLSYLRYMCLESHLLLNAVSACAMITLNTASKLDQAYDSSHRLYMAAISEISAGIAEGTLTGTEDSLLASVIWLCVYENSRIEVRRQSSIHAEALRRILLLREPMDFQHSSMSELVWERMCVESYIYHSAVTTLFDGQVSLIEDTLMVLRKFGTRMSTATAEIDVFQKAESQTSQSIIQSPVLGAPYQMFLFLVEGTRLARDICPGSVTDEILAWSRYYAVCKMQFTLEETASNYYGDSRRWIGKLYAVGIRVLFLYILSASELNHNESLEHYLSWCTEFNLTLSEARRLLISTRDDIGKTWGKFFLWPLAIIGAVLYDASDISVVKSWLDRIMRKSNSSSVMVIRKVLEDRIWTQQLSPGDLESPQSYMQGLTIMLDTNIMNEGAASLTYQFPL